MVHSHQRRLCFYHHPYFFIIISVEFFLQILKDDEPGGRISMKLHWRRTLVLHIVQQLYPPDLYEASGFLFHRNTDKVNHKKIPIIQNTPRFPY
jgi:hypothetical protein